ncbi:MAG: GNAT family N-acetyltransferase [Flavobacteriales bacterium]|nr:GNAT family N-acetyltransferase [Flavobacteriales bacterium]
MELKEIHLDPVPRIRTERLVLRELGPQDVGPLFEMRSDARTMQHIGRPRATMQEDAMDLIHRSVEARKSNEGCTWSLTFPDADECLGTIGYYRLKKEHYRGEIGYMLHPDHWGKGLMGEALRALVAHGLSAIGFHSIEAITDPDNTRSNRLLERHGFQREGLLLESYFHNGRFYDSAIYCIRKGMGLDPEDVELRYL